MSALRIIRLLVVAALWASLTVYAVVVGHDFFHHANRAVWVTADDGEAGIAYALATQARYAFLSSPELEGMSRLHGQFNYGPWYFALGAGLIWMFGYSLTVIRSIHFWVVIATTVAAAAWFRGRDRTAAPAIVGLGFLYFFGTIEWPMARPDSLVTAFAIVLVVAAGLAVTRRRAGYWFLAGLAAACGAFTHLIAASLVPSAAIVFGVFAAIELRDTDDRPGTLRRLMRSAVALAAGMAAGAAMFYGSFGFDLAEQYRFLLGYRQVTARPDGYMQAITKHFLAAFGRFSVPFRIGVVTTLAAGWSMTILAVVPRSAPGHRSAAAYLLPPVTVWTLYFLTIGKYTNYHSGYAILHHAMFLWTAAAIVWVALSAIAGRASLVLIAGLLASSLVLAQGIRLAAWQIADPPRAVAGDLLVPFDSYASHVLGSIPTRATAWGTVAFGIEAPDRIQLMQYSDAVDLALRVPTAQRAALAPDYIVWSYSESAETALEVLHREAPSLMIWSRLGQVLPGAQFRLASLTAGAPYGVTRVYARRTGAEERSAMPDVAAYDAPHRRWLTRIGAALPVPIARIPPVTMHIGYERMPAASLARTSVAAVLPAGAYLLRVAVSPGAGSSERRLIAATDPEMLTQTISEMGPSGDFVGYTDGDRSVFALVSHRGGPLYVSQFDDTAGAGIDDVTVYPIHDLLDPAEHPSRRRSLPDFAEWMPLPGVKVTTGGGRLRVEGDATALGYQVSSPVVPFSRDDRVELRVPSTTAAGRVCAGILDAGGTRWLVPADEWREELRFRGDGTGGFRVVFANCQRGTDRPEQSRFEIAPGAYVVDPPGLYADALASLALGPKRPIESLQLTDLHYVAPNVKRAANTWTIDGQAEGKYSYLIQSRPRGLEAMSRVLVAGRITRGGLTIGLLDGTKWVAQWNVGTPGDFRIVLEPPSNGAYAIVVANYLGDRLDTSIVIDRLDIYPTGMVPQP